MGNTVILITDSINEYKNNFSYKLNKIEFIDIDEFSLRANNFEKYYEHYSTNPKWFELRCLQRWFVLLDFLTKNSVDGFLYTDCDVLFFGLVLEEIKKIENYNVGLGSLSGAGVMLSGSIFYLKVYIKLLEDSYINKSGCYSHIIKYAKEFEERKLDGGISDMMFFDFINESRRDLKVLSLSDVIINNEIYDKNLSESEKFLKIDNRKRVEFEGEIPYFLTKHYEKIYTKTLHCSAVNKRLMKDLTSPCLRDL